MMVHKSLLSPVPQFPLWGRGWRYPHTSAEQRVLITFHKMLKYSSINSKQVFIAFLKITNLQILRSIAWGWNQELPWLLHNCSGAFFKEWVVFITLIIS